MQFIVSEDIFEKLPNACFGCVAVQGAHNREKRQAIEDLLAANVARCEAELEGLKVKELPPLLPVAQHPSPSQRMKSTA